MNLELDTIKVEDMREAMEVLDRVRATIQPEDKKAFLAILIAKAAIKELLYGRASSGHTEPEETCEACQ